MSDFNCEFNAPMFVDFNNLDNEENQANPEAYFEVNHEDIPLDAPSEDPKQPEPENSNANDKKPKPKNLVTSWGTSTAPALPPRVETPTRKALRKAVSDTIKEITNSPKLKLPEKRTNKPDMQKYLIKRLNPDRPLPEKTTTSTKARPTPPSSPAVSRWRKAIKQMTPEIMRQARNKRLNKEDNKVNIRAQLAKTRSLQAKGTKPTAKSTAEEPKSAPKLPLAPTEPVPFNFATSKRAQQKPVKGNEEVGFAKMLRSYQQHSTNKGTPVCTEVQPFNLSSGNRSRSQSATRHNRSASSSSDRTPRRRFRSASPTPSPWRPTQAQTPNLATRGRARRPDPNILSHEQKEELEVRGRKPFRANPAKIPAKPVGIPASCPQKPVVPHSPAFLLKGRLEERRKREADSAEKEPEPKRIVYAKPVPQHGVPVILTNTSRKATRVAPFSFESRDHLAQERKEQKIQAILDEEKRLREFKANPIPDRVFHPAPAPVHPHESTRPKPFDFRVDKRAGERLTKWEQAVEEDLQRQREAANFKAKPAAILEKEPFRPRPSEKPLAVPEEVELHSDRRAVERHDFQLRKKQMEAENEAMKKHMDQVKEHERQEEIKVLRQQAIHKAQPIRHYKPVTIAPSDKPLTNPKSPNFHNKHK